MEVEEQKKKKSQDPSQILTGEQVRITHLYLAKSEAHAQRRTEHGTDTDTGMVLTWS